ncbi:hypothetical protein [Pseudostreptobacillus hongkongensis]|uniref:hypothetical protein n=1 Tax=Pseudostreptobacillus hongkongensis TaxID=1162717 RepID=UPI000835B867|nr:hypothetical protein [Pseudostreptobacillus hongkongensis]
MSKYSEITTIEDLINLKEIEKREELENIEEIEKQENRKKIEKEIEIEKRYYKENMIIFKLTMHNNYIFYTVINLYGTILFFVFNGKRFDDLDSLIKEIEAQIRDKGDSR